MTKINNQIIAWYKRAKKRVRKASQKLGFGEDKSIEFDKNEPVSKGLTRCSSRYCINGGLPRREVSKSGYGHEILGKHSGFKGKMAPLCGCEKQRLVSKSLNTCLGCQEPINKIAESAQTVLFHKECFDNMSEARFFKCPYCKLKLIPGGVGVNKNTKNSENINCHELCLHSQ
jgi:hypothetical protein